MRSPALALDRVCVPSVRALSALPPVGSAHRPHVVAILGWPFGSLGPPGHPHVSRATSLPEPSLVDAIGLLAVLGCLLADVLALIGGLLPIPLTAQFQYLGDFPARWLVPTFLRPDR